MALEAHTDLNKAPTCEDNADGSDNAEDDIRHIIDRSLRFTVSKHRHHKHCHRGTCDSTNKILSKKTSPLIPFNYSADHLESKNLCKHILQRKLGLDINDFPLFGMICRLTEQKGLNILLPILEKFLVHKINLIIIGTGDVGFSQQLKDIASRHTDRMVFINSYDEILAHMTEAAADFFLMPSLYEPCGLNQMYSMSYGTLPIV